MKNHWSALPRFFLTFYRIVEKLGWKCIQISGTRIWRNYHNHVHIHRGANGFRLRFWLPLSTFRKKIFSFLISLLSMEYPSYYTLAVQLPRSLLRVEKSVCLSVFARVFGRVCVSLCLCVRARYKAKNGEMDRQKRLTKHYWRRTQRLRLYRCAQQMDRWKDVDGAEEKEGLMVRSRDYKSFCISWLSND